MTKNFEKILISFFCVFFLTFAYAQTSDNAKNSASSPFLSQFQSKTSEYKKESEEKKKSDEELQGLKKNNSISSDIINTYIKLANASSDYLVTPGDVYRLVYVAGTTPVEYSIFVDSNCMIKVSNLAVINGSGKTFLQLKQQVEAVVNRNYPMGGVQFFILSPSIFKIVVTGEVNQTFVKQAWALDRLSSVLDKKELTKFGSTRFVSVTSKDGNKVIYDLYKAQRDGDLSKDPYLRPEDKIEILKSARRVKILGSVERPGEYELLEGEEFKTLIEKYGGGLLERADKDRMELFRTFDAVGYSGRKIYIGKTAFENDYELRDKDSLYIPSYDDLIQIAFIEGAVRVEQEDASLASSKRIPIDFNENENYAFFIRRNIDKFSESSDLKNAYVRRGSEIFPIDIEYILYDKNYASDMVVKPYDVLMIPFSQPFVTVAGAVKLPGRYPYIPDRTWEYYVGLAGGFDKTQNVNDAINIYDKNNKQLSKEDVITPESTITARTTSFTYYFNRYAPIVTTVLTVTSTTISVLAACGVFNR